jgi:hypothetical protein
MFTVLLDLPHDPAGWYICLNIEGSVHDYFATVTGQARDSEKDQQT